MMSTPVHPMVTHFHNFKPDRVILTYTNESYYVDYDSSFNSWRNHSSPPASSSTTRSWWESDYPSGYSWPHIIGGASIITVIIMMIIFGNFLVIWAIIHDRTLKTTQNLFIASLAFADFFLGLVVIPFSLTNELMGYWFFGVIWCELYKAIDVLLCTASIMSLCLISLDRYWSITMAISYARQRTRKRAGIMIFTVWFISAVVSIPPLIGWKQPTRESQWPLCQLSEDIGYVLYSAFGSFFIPAFIMVFVYFKIYQAAKQRARKTVNKTNCTKEYKSEQKHSNESSVVEQGGVQDECHDLDYIAAASEDNGNDRGRVSNETPCDTFGVSVRPTISENEAKEQTEVKKVTEVSIDAVAEECSRLLATESDSTEPSSTTISRLDYDKEKCGQQFTRRPDSSGEQPESVSCSSDNLDSYGDHTNGTLRRFKILELRSNGSSTVAVDSRTNESKVTVLESLRRHLLTRTRNSRKRKQAVPRSHGDKIVDFHIADRQKRKLAKARERRATVVLGLVMAAFILCWFPFFALYLTSAFCAGCIPDMVFTVFFWIGYCNSALNPIIYTVFNRDFKRAFQKIVFGRHHGRR